MNSRTPRSATLLVAFLALSLATVSNTTRPQGAAESDDGKIVIYSDTYGVPHIFAPTAGEGLYAMGYAQAEDRLEELLKNYLRALGEMSAAFGPGEYLEDLQSRLWRHHEIAQRHYERIRPEVREHLAAFTRGINAYLETHPEEVPHWWGGRKVDVYMQVAHSRHFMWGWPAGQALAELGAEGILPGFAADARSSNQMAVAPSRTTLKAPILIIDPHLSWWGAQRFWEFRIHAGELHGSGFTIPGSPYVGLGHNDHVAWSMTTGGPDTADIYHLTLNPANPLQYSYDGGWRALVERSVSITVKGEEKPREVVFHESHHGPVVGRRDNKVYAAKLSYADEVQFGEAFYLLNTSRNIADVERALDLNQLMPQNVMAADTAGSIYYQRTGRVPIRPPGFDFSRPVDGSTSRSEWLGIHPAGDLISIRNPPQGYMQNCNVAPDVMMTGSTLTPDRFRSYLFNQPADRTHQRGARAVQMLQADDSISPEDAIAIALDTHCYQYDRWVDALREADRRFGAAQTDDPDYGEGLRDILGWDGHSRPESTGALKFYYWRRAVRASLGQQSYARLASLLADYMAALGKPKAGQGSPTDGDLRALVDSLAAAMRLMRANHGSLQVSYGRVFRVGRDDRSWPVGGGSLQEEGMATLRAIGFGTARADHTRWGQSGQASTQVVVLTQPVQSWTQPPIGQSDRPGSAFYRDQAEKLLSPGKMKPSWYRKEELLKNVVGRVELKMK